MWRKIFTGKNERRRFVRLPVALNIDFKINGESPDSQWHKGTTKNISPEGACLVTNLFTKDKWEEISQKKRLIYLCIYFPKEETIKAEAEVYKIDVEANVVWQEHKKEKGENTCLLGLHFTKIEKDSLEVICKFIIDNLVKGYSSA